MLQALQLTSRTYVLYDKVAVSDWKNSIAMHSGCSRGLALRICGPGFQPHAVRFTAYWRAFEPQKEGKSCYGKSLGMRL